MAVVFGISTMVLYLLLAGQAPVSGHLSPTPLVALMRTILVSSQLQLQILFLCPKGVHLRELRLYKTSGTQSGTQSAVQATAGNTPMVSANRCMLAL